MTIAAVSHPEAHRPLKKEVLARALIDVEWLRIVTLAKTYDLPCRYAVIA
jgi:hypothetical protein